jgi:lipopolysaccharide/colanic/teichoic acid biosynthesis glycosyltransferase
VPITRFNKKRLPAKGDGSICPEIESHEQFLRSLYIEERRSERSGRPFALMLLASAKLFRADRRVAAVDAFLAALRRGVRETDRIGWHKSGSSIGIIFTEIGDTAPKTLSEILHAKVSTVLTSTLKSEEIEQVQLSLHLYPENWSGHDGNFVHEPEVFPDTTPGTVRLKGLSAAKRVIDIVGSLLAIALIFPVLVATAIAVKLTSSGPILFKQQRVGQNGRTFMFLKFRSMLHQSSAALHQDFVKRFIAGDSVDYAQAGESKPVYKMTKDPRLTSIGAFLRRSCLDELPQLYNVLRGDMSLVGPRPPIPYEVECYSAWHRRRLQSIKPGITGLWQVMGRSKVSFDEMVRMDLRYVKSVSPWLDIKIMLMTIRVVFRGDGAY